MTRPRTAKASRIASAPGNDYRLTALIGAGDDCKADSSNQISK